MIVRVGTESDIEGILKLQSLNLYTNLSQEELKQGFVTTPFASKQIKVLLDKTGVFVAKKDDLVVGYIFAGGWDFFQEWTIFPYMISRLIQLKFQNIQITTDNTFQYGPVCIAKSLRGKKVFPQLFGIMRSSFANRYSIGLTFINQANARSLAAHQKIGLKIIDEFQFNSNSYYSLAFSTTY